VLSRGLAHALLAIATMAHDLSMFQASGRPARPCHTCGNAYDKAFEIQSGGTTYVFDCFVCAIQALAPPCAHCQCRVIGHGVENDGKIYCCGHCARQSGEVGVRDRIA
jgi:hypothetical protein